MPTKFTSPHHCARCHRIKRKLLYKLLLPVTVCISYSPDTLQEFPPGTLFCVRCLHALDPLYRGHSEGQSMHPDPLRPTRYIREDGRLATETVALQAPNTEPPPQTLP